MSINRQVLKQNAKQIIRASNPKVLNTGTIYILLALIMSVLSTKLMSVNLSESDIMQIYEHLMNENYEFAFEYMQRYMPPYSSYLIDVAIEVVMSIVSVGFIIFLLNTIRATSPCYGNLLDGFGIAGKIILLYLLESILVFLWSLLLIVPGIIASYRYRQAIYILIDHPEMSVLECIKESKRIMNGKKGELFVLDLSFLGWNLLSMFTVIGWAVQLWTVPYTGMTYALYYEHLRNEIGAGNSSAENTTEL